MNSPNLIRANGEPSLLTGTTKEFVTGSENNLISQTTLDLCKSPILDFYSGRTRCRRGKCTIVIEGLEVNGTNEMASCFYLFRGAGVRSAQTGKQAHSDLPKRGS